MKYGEILSKAWKIIWKHKILWVFGLMASCAGNGGGGSNGGGSGGGTNHQSQFFNNYHFELPKWMENTGQWFENISRDPSFWFIMAAIVVGMIILGVIFTLIGLFFGTMGKAALVRGTWTVEEGGEKLTFGMLWKEAWAKFWRVLGLTLLSWLAGIIFALALIVPFILGTVLTLGCGLVLLIPLAIVLGIFFKAFIELIIAAIAGEDLGVFEAIEKVWRLAINNLGHVLLMALILGAIGFLVGLVMILPLLLVMLPALLSFAGSGGDAITTGIIVSAVLMFLFILLAIFVNAVLSAYLGAAWTLTYRALLKRQAEKPEKLPAPRAPIVPPLPRVADHSAELKMKDEDILKAAQRAAPPAEATEPAAEPPAPEAKPEEDAPTSGEDLPKPD